jgi:hypothetical protein
MMLLRSKYARKEGLLSRFRGERLCKVPTPPLWRIVRSTSQLRIDAKSLHLKPHVMTNVSRKRAFSMGSRFVTFVIPPILCVIGLVYGQGWPSVPVSDDHLEGESISATIEKTDREKTKQVDVSAESSRILSAATPTK